MNGYKMEPEVEVGFRGRSNEAFQKTEELHCVVQDDGSRICIAANPKKPPQPFSDVVAAGTSSQVSAGSVQGGQIKYFDFNFHAMKKGVSSTMLDVALLMANCSQLKSVILSGNNQPFYWAMIILLTASIFLQVAVGCTLIWLSRININVAHDKHQNRAEFLNNTVITGIFFLTVINVFTASIGISHTPVVIPDSV